MYEGQEGGLFSPIADVKYLIAVVINPIQVKWKRTYISIIPPPKKTLEPPSLLSYIIFS